jgi:hypothetical protein
MIDSFKTHPPRKMSLMPIRANHVLPCIDGAGAFLNRRPAIDDGDFFTDSLGPRGGCPEKDA